MRTRKRTRRSTPLPDNRRAILRGEVTHRWAETNQWRRHGMDGRTHSKGTYVRSLCNEVFPIADVKLCQRKVVTCLLCNAKENREVNPDDA